MVSYLLYTHKTIEESFLLVLRLFTVISMRSENIHSLKSCLWACEK